ncbi:MAG TPA: hypothetical protein DCE55_29305 [Planctomycetaceae bacterium]|nr:hypothetical protein [Planctomycetaceae bacterium]|tara:strand:- start:11702 stop:12031 length:330 start_codon:yes stop_codon:yes gene_type:complete
MAKPIAMHCGTPCVWTFVFSKCEYYCVKCGGAFGMFGTATVDATDELLEKLEANKKAFHAVAKDCIPPAMYRETCVKCQDREGDHLSHATNEELKASAKAYATLLGGIV